MPEASIVLKAHDQISGTLKSLTSESRALDKEFEVLQRRVQQLSQRNEKFNESYADLAAQVRVAKAELKEAGKALDQLNTEENRLSFQNAEGKVKSLTDAMQAMKDASADTRREIRTTQQEMRKLGDGGGSAGGLLSAMAQAGGIKLLGDSAVQWADTLAGSVLGSSAGTLFSGALSGVTNGAAMGALLGPAGIAAGAAIGGAAGLLTGGSQIYQQQDDAFKGYVQDAVEGQLSAMDETLTGGSSIAGSREQTRLAFARRFGSEEAADEYLERVRIMAMDTTYDYDEITGYSKSLLNSYDPEQVFGILQTLSDASAGLDLNTADVNVLIQGLARMRTTGKANAEYLNYFSERGIDVYTALANATGADRSQVADMASRGDISGETAAQAILDYIDLTFGGLSEKLADTYDAMVDNLADAQAEIDAAMGAGYNDARKSGLAAQQDWLSGESGAAVSEAYEAIGAWKADLENQREELERRYIDEAMNTTDYQQAKAANDAAAMGELIMAAKINAQNEYNRTAGAELLESEKSLIAAVREDTAVNDAYWNAGYELGLAFSRGRSEGMAADLYEGATRRLDTLGGDSAQLGDGLGVLADIFRAGAGRADLMDGSSHAFGLDYVPYDNYPALLHQGERVLTAEESRRAGGSISVNVSGNQFVVRDEADVDAIAARLADEIEARGLAYGG